MEYLKGNEYDSQMDLVKIGKFVFLIYLFLH